MCHQHCHVASPHLTPYVMLIESRNLRKILNLRYFSKKAVMPSARTSCLPGRTITLRSSRLTRRLVDLCRKCRNWVKISNLRRRLMPAKIQQLSLQRREPLSQPQLNDLQSKSLLDHPLLLWRSVVAIEVELEVALRDLHHSRRQRRNLLLDHSSN